MDDSPHVTSAAASPASSSTSDGDAFNTASARIHFGPIRSPEKKFVPVFARRNTLHPGTLNSPVRRSARFSMPANGTLLRDSPEVGDDEDEGDQSDDEDDENVTRSRSGTPENDRFPQDEPSSVLATRIIQAHDNPSPPPSTPSIRAPKDSTGFSLVDLSESPTPALPMFDSLTIGRDQPLASPTLASIPFPSSNDQLSPPSSLPLTHDAVSSPSPRLPSGNNTLQRDLISFGSFSTSQIIFPLDVAVKASPHAAGPLNLPSSNDNPSVDDLFSRSPSPPHPPSSQQSLPLVRMDSSAPKDGEYKGKEREENTPETSDEQAVEAALSFPEPEDPSRGSAVSPSPTPPVFALPSADEELQEGEEELPRTPVRRSTRPRRSGTPHIFANVVSSIDEAEPSSTQTSLLQGLLAPPSAQTQRKRHKGKERATSPGDEVVSDSQDGRSGSASAENSKEESEVDEGREKLQVKRKRKDERNKERERTGQSTRMTGQQPFLRELGSLSPDSASVLTRLVPSLKSSPILEFAEPPAEGSQTHADPTTPQPPTLTFSLFPQSVSDSQLPPEAPRRFTSPVRFSSPVRFVAPNSPTKFASLEIPNRTPARRIPNEKAAAQLRSYDGVSGMSTNLGAPRTPVFNIRPTDSPARRVNIPNVPTPSMQAKAPVRGMSRERSRSVEPRPFRTEKGREKSGLADHHEEPTTVKDGVLARPQTSATSSSFTTMRPGKLPFPLVPPNMETDLPKSIPEVTNETETLPPTPKGPLNGKSAPPQNSSPVKSSLKQPSSRIPRISVKPYARPALTIPKESRLPTVMRKVDLSKVSNSSKTTSAKGLKILRTGSGSGDSSDDIKAITNGGTMAGPSTPSQGMAVVEATASAGLKRKRVAEKQPSPNKPIVVVRQVVSGIVTPKIVNKPPAAQLDANPVKNLLNPVKFRRVIDRDLGGPQVRTGLNEDLGSHGPTSERRDNAVEPSKSLNADLISPPPPTLPAPPSTPSQIPGDKPILDDLSVSSPDPGTKSQDSPGKVRRTTRLRKPAQPTSATDIFGQVDIQPLQLRRKANTQAPVRFDRGGFSRMSAVALKALTSSNTAKNQRYLAAKLETEVVRKEGARPDSPTVKVKTVSQRQKEERGKQRKERAERRARRSEDGSAGGQSDTDGQSDRGDSSMIEEAGSEDGRYHSPYRKHRRGPGDDEDYETPDKLERPLKRLKLGDEDGMRDEDKRRVRWDRGLSSTIYLHEVQPRTRARPPEDIIKKGCLAKTAKALRLDTLGNLPDAESPLPDLIQENIVVKKFVYDNDVEPIADVIVVKNTRSRSKKGKI